VSEWQIGDDRDSHRKKVATQDMRYSNAMGAGVAIYKFAEGDGAYAIQSTGVFECTKHSVNAVGRFRYVLQSQNALIGKP